MNNKIMTNNAIEYSIKQLFKRANPSESIQYNVLIDSKNNKIIITFNEIKNRIIFNLVEEFNWKLLIKGEVNELKWIDNSRKTFKIPVIFWVKENLPFSYKNDKDLVFNGDIISSSFFMLSRWEEKQNKDLDIHGRFKYENSISCKYKFIDIPVVDEYALLLRKKLQQLFFDLNLGKNTFHMKLSHDIDDIRRFKNIKQAIRTFGGDILETKSIDLFKKSLLEYGKSYKNPEKDPYFLGILELAKLSKENRIDSSFYFKTADKSSHDSGYKIDEYVKKCILYLQEQGFEIGFHPGYYTHHDFNKFMEEKERLDRVLGYSKYGGRQHYLRFDVNSTWEYWEKAGLKYDSTLGYAEHEGFRAGTCHPFTPFSICEDRQLNILEVPLIVMEGSLISYRNLRPEEGLKVIRSLINRCKEVEGVFTLLWHNTSIYRGLEVWFEDVYKGILREYGEKNE